MKSLSHPHPSRAVPVKSRGVLWAAGWKSQILQAWSCLTWVPCLVFLLEGGGWGWITELSPKRGCDLVSIYQSHFSSKSGIYQTLRMPQVLGSHSFPFLLSLLTCNQLCFNCIKMWNKNSSAVREEMVSSNLVIQHPFPSSLKRRNKRWGLGVLTTALFFFYNHNNIIPA